MKTILILSGGLDSTVLAAKLKAEGCELKCLTVDYGQRHAREVAAAEKVCAALGVEHKVVRLHGLRELMAGSSQTDPSVPVPHGHYAEDSMKKTVVPNRNALLLSAAFAWAFSCQADTVAYAAHSGDHAVYPDCREEFCAPFAQAMKNADWHVAELERPFLELTKAQVVAEGAALGAEALMALSYSCYEGRAEHCGLCGTCVERKEAFSLAGVADPTEYEA